MILMKVDLKFFPAIILALSALIPYAQAGCSVGGCGGGSDSWLESAKSFMNSDVPLLGVAGTQSTNSISTGSFQAGQPAEEAYVATGSRAASFPAPGMLKSLDAISEKDVVLDVSGSRSPGQAHIRGSINLPAKDFFYENGTLRNATDMAAILGKAGISQEDALMVYSDSFGSGEATAVLYALRRLGHDNVRALDGGLDNWIASSLPMETEENVRSPVSYALRLRAELFVDYDYVKSGQAQMVDARSFQEFGKSRILNATFISPESVLEEGRLKNGTSLMDTFARLNAGRAAVVYSDDIYGASVVWFALQLMGFDARIYSWQDWQAHEARPI
jgi:thiosulfate/3-mercaptopyruvate sulfurtransferase